VKDRPIRVILADDHPLLREGVARSLTETGSFVVLAEGATADDAIRLAEEHRPDIALIDLSMPGSGLAAVRRIAESAGDVSVVVLTVSEADDDVIAALKSGAKGYVLKGVGSAALVDILHAVADGESYVPPSLAARLLTEMHMPHETAAAGHDPLSRLSRREEEILSLVATGMSNKEVARRFDLQEKTIKHHMTRILHKLQVRNRTEAAILLRSAGSQDS
jgi:two-component system, NarL family, nitrate/nitrite response regulator NarL